MGAGACQHDSTTVDDETVTVSITTPQAFICPVTHEVFHDPVITDDGQTYERDAIETWFRLGHITSPLTGVRLASRDLRPNIALRATIEGFHEARPELERRRLHAEDMRVALQVFEDLLSRSQGATQSLQTHDPAIVEQMQGSGVQVELVKICISSPFAGDVRTLILALPNTTTILEMKTFVAEWIRLTPSNFQLSLREFPWTDGCAYLKGFEQEADDSSTLTDFLMRFVLPKDKFIRQDGCVGLTANPLLYCPACSAISNYQKGMLLEKDGLGESCMPRKLDMFGGTILIHSLSRNRTQCGECWRRELIVPMYSVSLRQEVPVKGWFDEYVWHYCFDVVGNKLCISPPCDGDRHNPDYLVWPSDIIVEVNGCRSDSDTLLRLLESSVQTDCCDRILMIKHGKEESKFYWSLFRKHSRS